MMTKQQLLEKYILLQKDIMFDELYELDFATICYSQHDTSSIWNNAVISTQLTASQQQAIEQKLISLQRTPAFYYLDSSELSVLTKQLIETGYQQEAADSFMLYDKTVSYQPAFDSIKKVTNETELQVFLETFDACYQNDDPTNPYGELGEYLTAARIAWEKHQQSNRLEYFIAYKNEQPVAVASLTNFEGMGYISNVGSLRAVRGEGYGKLVTLFAIHYSQQNGNQDHCLITEAGTNPYEFYNALGFNTQCTAQLLVNATL